MIIANNVLSYMITDYWSFIIFDNEVFMTESEIAEYKEKPVIAFYDNKVTIPYLLNYKL